METPNIIVFRRKRESFKSRMHRTILLAYKLIRVSEKSY